MKLWPFGRLAQRSEGDGQTTGVHDTWDTWQRVPHFGYSGSTLSGVAVTSENPITHHTVFSCINVIAEDCAMLPLYLYRERGASRKAATDHPLYEALLTSPCPHMTAFQFWKLVLFEKFHYGNHYSLIERDVAGRVIALYPIENGRCQPYWYRDPQSGRKRRAYRVTTESGLSAVFLEDEIFHVQGLPVMRGPNYGLFGVSVWAAYQTETVGGALAVEEAANASLANSANLSGFVATEGPLDPEVQSAVRKEIQEVYGGARKTGKIGLFGGGAKWHTVTQNNQEAQRLESRKFNRSVIAGILRVTAHLINDLEKGTFSNVEHLDIGHYKHCLYPNLTDLCQTIHKDLLAPTERQTLYCEHDPTVILLGDQKTLGEVLDKAVNNARMTPNEARAITNLPPKDGGDELYINGATVPLRLAATGIYAKAGAKAKDSKPTATDTTPTGEGGSDNGDSQD